MTKKTFDISNFAQHLGGVFESDTGLQSISIARIAPNKRNFYPRVEDFEGLKDSIQANGLLEPLTVVPGDGPNTYRLISGENRYRAIRALYEESGFDPKWENVTCLVLPPMTEEQEQCAVIESNRQRKKTGALLAEEARKLTAIYAKRKEAGEELPGRIRDRVAEALKVSSTKLAMLNAIQENLAVPGFVRDWKEGQLNESVAYEISKLDREVQYRLLDWHIDTRRDLMISTVQTFAKMWNHCKHNCPHTGGLCPNAERMIRDKFRADEFKCAGCCESCLLRTSCATACQYITKEDPPEPGKNKALEDPRLDWKNMRACFQSRLQNARESTGLSRKEFAERIGEFQGTYSAWENGNLPGSDRMAKLAVALGVTTDYLYGLTDEPGAAAPLPEMPMEEKQSLAAVVWYPASVQPELGQDIIVVDSFGCADDVTYRGEDWLDYGIRWSDVAFWTSAPSEATPADETQPLPECQLMICGWMPGGTTPREPCSCAVLVDMGDTKLKKYFYRWSGEYWMFETMDIRVEQEPVAWMALPEYVKGESE